MQEKQQIETEKPAVVSYTQRKTVFGELMEQIKPQQHLKLVTGNESENFANVVVMQKPVKKVKQKRKHKKRFEMEKEDPKFMRFQMDDVRKDDAGVTSC